MNTSSLKGRFLLLRMKFCHVVPRLDSTFAVRGRHRVRLECIVDRYNLRSAILAIFTAADLREEVFLLSGLCVVPSI